MPINLIPFCSTDETWYQLRVPFTVREHVYATDGRIIVRLPKTAYPEYDSNRWDKSASALALFDNLPKDWQKTAEWTRLVSVQIPPRHFRVCNDCGGGPPGCEECDNGRVQDFEYVKVGKKLFNNHYLLLMVEHLPNVHIAANVGTEHEQTPFEFDGGLGLLMPVRPEAQRYGYSTQEITTESK